MVTAEKNYGMRAPISALLGYGQEPAAVEIESCMAAG
jgi:hypothetical protein